MNHFTAIGDEAAIETLGWTLLHFVWQGALIGLVCALVLGVLRRRAPASRYAMGCGGLLVMAFAPVVTLGVLSANRSTMESTPVALTPVPNAIDADAGDANRGADDENDAASTAVSRPLARRPAGEPLTGDGTNAIAAADTAVSKGGERAIAVPWHVRVKAWLVEHMVWIVAVWLVGVVTLCGRLIVAWIGVCRLKWVGVTVAGAAAQAMLRDVCDRLAIRRVVRLLESTLADVPMVVGWFAPVVILPVSVLSGLPPEQVRALLAHELAHVRRYDALVNAVQVVAETVLFYHPAVWWLSQRVRIEREHCCDDLAVSAYDQRVTYVKALAEAASLARSAAPLAMAATSRGMLGRVQRLLGVAPTPSTRTAWVAGPLLITILAVVVIGANASLSLPVNGTQNDVEAIDASAPGSEALPAADAEPILENRATRGLVSTPLWVRRPWPSNITDADQPRVVSVSPADGSCVTGGPSEIRVRFDRPMNPLTVELNWYFRQDGYHAYGPARYDDERYEFVIPITLPADGDYRVGVNDPFHDRPSNGFQSAEGIGAAPFEWSFITRKLDYGSSDPGPQVVSIEPPPGSDITLITEVRVQFDQDMIPDEFRTIVSDKDTPPNNTKASVLPTAAYDEQERTFTFTLALPADWQGNVELRDLRSRIGTPAAPIRLDYTTRQTLYTEKQRAQIERGQRDPILREVLRNVKESRRRLASACETYYETRCFRRRQTGYLDDYRSYCAVFKMQEPCQFYADVSGIMQVPYCIGSDGERCWWYYEREGERKLEVCPYDEMDEKNVHICDLFLTQEKGIEEVIADRNLMYAGEKRLAGRRCHVLEQRYTKLEDDETEYRVRRWWIDAETWRPVRMTEDWAFGLHRVISIAYDRVNEVIPDSEFNPLAVEGLTGSASPPLGEEFDTRFLNVIDGSTGRMSVRWGKKGPGRRSSSGLN